MAKRAKVKTVAQEGSTKDKAKKPPRRPAPVAGNKRQRKSFYSRGSR